VINVNMLTAYDPATNTWESLPPMPTSRGGLTSGALSGRVHVVGGEDLSPGGATYHEHEVYDPLTRTWTTTVELPTSRHGLTSQVIDGAWYVIAGGPTPNLSVSDVVEIFRVQP
jgi:hypothetical protein